MIPEDLRSITCNQKMIAHPNGKTMFQTSLPFKMSTSLNATTFCAGFFPMPTSLKQPVIPLQLSRQASLVAETRASSQPIWQLGRSHPLSEPQQKPSWTWHGGFVLGQMNQETLSLKRIPNFEIASRLAKAGPFCCHEKVNL